MPNTSDRSSSPAWAGERGEGKGGSTEETERGEATPSPHSAGSIARRNRTRSLARSQAA